MLTRLVVITYPALILAIAYLVAANHSRNLQSQFAPHGYHTDKDESLSEEDRIAISRAKRWVEEKMMGNAASLDARYQVRRQQAALEVHVVFVTGYSPSGTPLYIPQGQCVVRLDNLEESDTFFVPELEPLSEFALAIGDQNQQL